MRYFFFQRSNTYGNPTHETIGSRGKKPWRGAAAPRDKPSLCSMVTNSPWKLAYSGPHWSSHWLRQGWYNEPSIALVYPMMNAYSWWITTPITLRYSIHDFSLVSRLLRQEKGNKKKATISAVSLMCREFSSCCYFSAIRSGVRKPTAMVDAQNPPIFLFFHGKSSGFLGYTMHWQLHRLVSQK